jgi:hypothetical protein
VRRVIMPENEKAVSALSETFPMSEVMEGFLSDGIAFLKTFGVSEPLGTFVSNISAVKALLGLAVTNIDKSKRDAQKHVRGCERNRRRSVKVIKEAKASLKELYEIRRMFKRLKAEAKVKGDTDVLEKIENEVEETSKYIASCKELTVDTKKTAEEFDELYNFFSIHVDDYVKQGEILMPMVFVYLVTCWDAFVLDTVRNILRVHPQVITTGDAKTEMSRAALWGARSIADVRNDLIEEVVRDLDYDRKKLVKYFADYWGIDWKESGILLDDVVEIRARRDIWVHNNGVVNKQYVEMVGEDNSLKEGQVAKISGQYIDASVDKLTALAIYIHGLAHEKHYSKADVG